MFTRPLPSSPSAPPPTDSDLADLDQAAPADQFPAGTLLQLALAAVAGLIGLRVLAGPEGLFPPAPRATEVTVEQEHHPGAGRAVAPAVPASGGRAGANDAVQYLNPADAAVRLRFPVREPRALPAGFIFLGISWVPDGPVLIPGQRPVGTLKSWYATDQWGIALVMEQGPGMGVAAPAAPSEQHGAAVLRDGTAVVWSRDVAGIAPQLAVGTAARGDMLGWRLSSGVLTLDELLRVAEQLE